MKRIQNEIKRISEQRSHQEPQFWDVFDSAIPYVVYCIDMNIQNRKRRKEIHIHAVLLKNCSLDRSCDFVYVLLRMVVCSPSSPSSSYHSVVW